MPSSNADSRLANRARRLALLGYLLSPVVVIPDLTPITLGMTDVILPLAVLAIVAGRIDLLSGPSLLYLLYLTALTLGAVSGGADELLRALRYTSSFLAFPLAVATARRDADVGRYLRLGYFALLVAVGLGVALHLSGVDAIIGDPQTLYDSRVGHQARAGGLISNTGPFGHVVATFFVLGTFGTHRLTVRHRVALRALTISLTATALLLSSSRAGLLAVAVAGAGALTYSLADRRRNLPTPPKMLVVVAGAAGFGQAATARIADRGWFFTQSVRRLDMFGVLERSNSTFLRSESRLASWSDTANLIPQYPLIGTGPERVLAISGRAVDNSYLNAMVTAGAIGGLFFILFWLATARSATAADRANDEYLLIPLVAAQLTIAMLLDIQSQWYSLPVALAVIGLLAPSTRRTPAAAYAPLVPTRPTEPAVPV